MGFDQADRLRSSATVRLLAALGLLCALLISLEPAHANSTCDVPPAGLEAALGGGGESVILTWQASPCGPDTYAVYRRNMDQVGDRMQFYATVDGATLTHTDSKVQAGITYRYRVKSNNIGKRSDYAEALISRRDDPDIANAGGVEPVFQSGQVTTLYLDEGRTGEFGDPFIVIDPDSPSRLFRLSNESDQGIFTVDLDAEHGQLSSAPLDYESNPGKVFTFTLGVRDTHLDQADEDMLDITVHLVNVDEPGTVSIAGDVTAGEELTASLESDLDGLPDPTNVTWQWSRAMHLLDTFTDISTATSASYTPTTAADTGSYLRATAFYTDLQGPNKSASSTTSEAFGATNSDPYFARNAIPLLLLENVTEPTDLRKKNAGQSFTAVDGDGDTLTYSISDFVMDSGDADSFTVNSGTGQLTTKQGATFDFETQDRYFLVLGVQDGKNTLGAPDPRIDDTMRLNIIIENEDELGSVTIRASNTNVLPVEFSFTVTDPDGILTALETWWYRGESVDGTFERIEVSDGEPYTGITYETTANDVGKYIRVRARYMDNQAPNKIRDAEATWPEPIGGSDTSLSSLSVSPKNIIGFDGDRTSYEVGVENSVTQATVSATASDDEAMVDFAPPDADLNVEDHQVVLSEGHNVVTVTVTAEDGLTNEYKVSVNRGVTDLKGWQAGADLDGLIAAGNETPRGIWSDETTVWVADGIDDKLYAYNLSDGVRDDTRDITLAADNDDPQGIWSNETIIWVADPEDDKLYAYNLSDGMREVARDINTRPFGNHDMKGIWSDETIIWVADEHDHELYAYNLSDGVRDDTRDITLAAGNTDSSGISSDGTTMWVADRTDDKLRAYRLSDGRRDVGGDINTLAAAGNNDPQGMWSDETTMWVADGSDGKIYAYIMPLSGDASLSELSVSPKNIIGFDGDRRSYEVGVENSVTQATVTATASHDAAMVDVAPPDADDNVVGHQVDLSAGRNAVTVTVTAENGFTQDYTVSVNQGVTDSTGWQAGADLDGLIAAGNNDPRGIWSDETTVWVTDESDDKLYAYNLSDGLRDDIRDITLHADNDDPRGIWSNGTIIWVADESDQKLYAYNLSNGIRDDSGDITLATNNFYVRGIWSNGRIVWVVDDDAVDHHKLFAYDLSNGNRVANRDINTLQMVGNLAPDGVWSDKTTIWVTDRTDNKLYAYNLSDGTRDSSLDIETLRAAGNGDSSGIWSDGTTVWVADQTDDKLYAYLLPKPEDDGPGVSIEPTTLTIDEGASKTYTVVLDTEPSAGVTVTISGHSGSDVSLSDTELDFTTGNWDTAQTVTVTAEEDDDATADTDVTLNHAVTGASEYAAIAADDVPSVAVKITENDSVDVTVTITGVGGVTVIDGVNQVDGASFEVLVTFSETIGSTFDHTDITLTNAQSLTASDIITNTSGLAYTVTIRPLAGFSGIVTVQVPAGVAQDSGSQDNQASNVFSATVTLQSACVTGGAVPAGDEHAGLARDCEILLGLHDTLVGSATLSPAWSVSNGITTWDGIFTKDERVHHISLGDKNLDGIIPPELGMLSALVTLSLSENDLSGTIPSELGDLTNLNHLSLSFNQLTGVLPTTLGNLEDLISLNLRYNELSGRLPDMSRMTSLQDVLLNDNQLTGEIPSALTQISTLEYLILSRNQLTGTVPDWSGMPNLQLVQLDRNQLTGLSASLTDLPNLLYFYVDRNKLTGQIPTMSNLPKLQRVWLHCNQLTGSIPASLNELQTLSSVNLTDNYLSGELPDLSNMSSLATLTLGHNALVGDFSDTASLLAKLPEVARLRLRLNGNLFVGVDQHSGEIAGLPSWIEPSAFNPCTPRVSFDSATYMVREGSPVDVVVNLDSYDQTTVTIPLVTTDLGGASPADYSGVPVNIPFVDSGDEDSGSEQHTFAVTATDDSDNDDGESVMLTFGTLPEGVVKGHTITATIELIDNDEPAGVSISESTLTIDEGGSDTYTLVLDSEPSADVTVTISGHSGTDVSLSDTELDFTPGNWDTAQTVTVTAGQDDDAAADTDVTLTHTVTGASEYAAIDAAAIPRVSVTITEDDSPGVSIEPTTLTIDEGSSDTYTVALNTQPSADVTVTISGHTGTDVSLSDTELDFTPGNWGTSQTVTVTAGEDDDATADTDVTLTHAVTGASEYAAIADDVVPSVLVKITENDSAGVSISESTLTIDEGGSDTYTVVLDTEPSADVTVTISGHSGTDVSLFDTELDFTPGNWGTSQTVTVTAGQDDDAVSDADVTLTHTVSGASEYAAIAATDVPRVVVTITENDSAGVSISESTLTIDEGGSDTYTVVLDTEPSADVTVTISGHSGTDVSLSDTELDFTPGNWGTSQTVTVTAGEDDDATADTDVTLTHALTGASEYAAIAADDVPSVAVRINEDDSAGVAISDSSLTIVEGGSDTYTVKLNTEPSADVTVTISGHSGTDVSLFDTELDFTTGNWDTAQTVTVTAEEDDDATADTDVTLTHALTGASEYAAIAADDVPSVSVTINEDDSAGVSISRTSLTIGEGGSETYTVVLDTEPSAEVTVTISGHAGTDVTLSDTELTFTDQDWDTAQTVTVTAEHDDDAAAEAEVTLSHALTGASEYAAIDADDVPSVAVRINEDDSAGVAISRTTLTINEGGSDTYTVALNTQPSADVTVTISGHTGTDVSLSGQTLTSDELTFTPDNWSTAQTVTVNAGEDDDAADESEVILSHSVTGASEYAAIAAAVPSVSVTITDDDAFEELTCDNPIRRATLQLGDETAEDWGVFRLIHHRTTPGPPSSLDYDEFVYDGKDYKIGSIALDPAVPTGSVAGSPYRTAEMASFAINIYRKGSDGRFHRVRSSDYGDWTLFIGGMAFPFDDVVLTDGSLFVWHGQEFNDLFNAWSASTTYQLCLDDTPASGTTMAPPSAPEYLRLFPGYGSLVALWRVPDNDSHWLPPLFEGTDIIRYEVQIKELGDSWTNASDVLEYSVPPLEDNPQGVYTFRGLTNGVDYSVRVRAVNAAGEGSFSAEAWGTPQYSMPRLSDAVVDVGSLSLNFNRALDAASVPAARDFRVLINGESHTPKSVMVTGSKVILTLPEPAVHVDKVNVMYILPDDIDAPRIRDGDRYYYTTSERAYRQVRNETPEASLPPVTVSVEGLPASHNGVDNFTFRIVFSESVRVLYSYGAGMLTVSGGTVTASQNLDRRTERWEFTIAPHSEGDVAINLPGGRECEYGHIPCGAGERPLSNSLELTVPFQ